MLLRPLLGVTLLAAIGPATSFAQRPEYTPGTSRYRVVVTGKTERDQMGMQQSTTFESRQALTMVLARPHRDTLSIVLTIDSLSASADGVPVPEAGGGGLSVRASLSPAGDLYAKSARAAGDSAIVGVDMDDVARFLPPLRGALRAGSKWSDTVSRPVGQLGLQLNRLMVADYEVLGDTTMDGERAWRIARRTNTTVSGEGAAMGQKIVVEAKGVGTGTVYVSAAGRFLGGSSSDDVKSTAHIGSDGTTVTESRTMTTRVERMK